MQELTHLIEVYGLLLIFAAVLLDEIGLPVPSLPALVVAGAIARDGHFSLPSVIASALGGALVADIIWYWACRRLGRRVLALLCRISLAPDSCVRQTENLFSRLGAWSLLFARYIPAFSNIAVAMAAIVRVPLVFFLALNLAGSFFYYGLAVLVGALFHRAVADVLHTMETFGTVSIAALIAAFAAYILFRWWERVTFIRQLRMDRITIEELVGLIESGKAPIILDVRSAETRGRDGIIPGRAGGPSRRHPSAAQADRTGYRDRDLLRLSQRSFGRGGCAASQTRGFPQDPSAPGRRRGLGRRRTHAVQGLKHLVAAGGDPDALVPRAARSDVLQFVVLALLGHVHRVGDAGHGFDGDKAARISRHVVRRGQRNDRTVIGERCGGAGRGRGRRRSAATASRRCGAAPGSGKISE